MTRFIIERNLPRIGAARAAELRAIAQKSCSVLEALGPEIQWVHSYVTDDRIYCVYLATSEALVREHARQGGFPADHVAAVVAVIDPATADA